VSNIKNAQALCMNTPYTISAQWLVAFCEQVKVLNLNDVEYFSDAVLTDMLLNHKLSQYNPIQPTIPNTNTKWNF
jgi:hypothetical protein